MAVFVDNMRASFGDMVMCHCIADTHDELVAMMDRIGVQRKWIQKPGTYHEHFDICLAKRKLAVRAGAIEITTKELVQKSLDRKMSAAMNELKDQIMEDLLRPQLTSTSN